MHPTPSSLVLAALGLATSVAAQGTLGLFNAKGNCEFRINGTASCYASAVILQGKPCTALPSDYTLWQFPPCNTQVYTSNSKNQSWHLTMAVNTIPVGCDISKIGTTCVPKRGE